MRPVARLALFLALAVASYFATGAVARTAVGFAAILAILLAAATILCARLSGENLVALGFSVSRQRAFELGYGFGVGAGLIAAVALASGLSPRASWRDALVALLLVLCLFLAEELFFRGYAFQQLARIGGAWTAVVLSASAFGAYHLRGAGAFWMPALGGLVFGYALVRTGGLALPIGLHWGGNWVQALTPERIPRAGYVLALAVMALLILVSTSRGNQTQRSA